MKPELCERRSGALRIAACGVSFPSEVGSKSPTWGPASIGEPSPTTPPNLSERACRNPSYPRSPFDRFPPCCVFQADLIKRLQAQFVGPCGNLVLGPRVQSFRFSG